MSKKPVCVVVGVGPGIGASLARRFHAEGYLVVLLARTRKNSEPLLKELDADAKAMNCDVSDGADVAKVFLGIEKDVGPIAVVAFNAGSGVWGTIDDLSFEGFEMSWRVNAAGLFHVAKAVTPAMKERGHGAIIVTGATASRRGAPFTTAFAPAKAAQRSLCEALAKTLWPHGIHVALIIVDGMVDLESTRARMKDQPDEFFVSPIAVAETALWLAKQDRQAWAFEVEARPFAEKW
jgi:NAD(P)-dependent dehydrogenase (short-subunit alcohol dehydrogenase family)